VNRLRFRPLRSRLLRRLLLLTLVFGCLAMGVQSWMVFHQQHARFERDVALVGETHLPLLSVALWEVEIPALEQLVRQIGSRSEIARAELVSDTGLHLSSSGLPTEEPADAVLPIRADGTGDLLGELRIYANHEQLYEMTLQEGARHVAEVGLLIGLISLLVAYWLHRELDVPLKRIAAYVAGLSPEKPAEPPALRPAGRSWYDELDLVSRGFETLHQGLLRHGAERDAAMAELAAERDLLDSRVARRTQALQRVAGFQEILSRTLLRCLHLESAGFPAALSQSLEELCGFVGARACGLAERDADGRWVWRVCGGDDWHPGETLSLPESLHGWCLLPDETGQRWGYVSLQHDHGRLLAFQGLKDGEDDGERRQLQVAAEIFFGLLERWDSAQALEDTRAELELLSLSDPLTSLANRRRFDQAKHQEARRAVRHQHALAVIMIDVDHFKAYNDHFGHAAGDACLVRIAGCLSALFQRAGEVPARLGGEEFAVLLPGYDTQRAMEAAERLRSAVAALQMEHPVVARGYVSVSLGVAGWSPEDSRLLDVDELLARADRALYQAKAGGRDRVAQG